MISVFERYDPTGLTSMREVEASEWEGKSVYALIPDKVKKSDATIQVLYNNVELDDVSLRTTILKDSDSVIFRAVPQGGLIISLTPLAGSFIGNLLATAINIGVAIGIHFLIRELQGDPDTPRLDGGQSPNYAFDFPKTTIANGTPVILHAGRMRNAGQVLEISQKVGNIPGNPSTIDILVGLGEGGEVGWESIGGITQDVDDLADFSGGIDELVYINDQRLSEFPADNIRLSVRLGTAHQKPITRTDTVVHSTPFDELIQDIAPPSLIEEFGEQPWTSPPAPRFSFQTSEEVDKVRLLFRVDRLSTIDTRNMGGVIRLFVQWKSTGDSFPTITPGVAGSNSVELFVSSFITPVGGGSFYQVEFEVPERQIVDVRIRDWFEEVAKYFASLGGNPGSSTSVNFRITLVSVDEIINEVFSYPGKALLKFSAVASSRLSGEKPAVSAVCEGPKVRVYTDTTTFSYSFTRNAAWVILYLLTYKRALGSKLTVEDNINVQSFIDSANYCDELVSDGRGGTEPRAYLDPIIDTRKGGLEWLDQLSKSAGLRLIKSGQVYSLVPDNKKEPVMQFNRSNAKDISIGYESLLARPNFVESVILNEDDDFHRSLVISLDENVQGTVDFDKQSRESIGVVRESQASRIGDLIVRKGKTLYRVAEWVASIEAVRATPFDVVEIADEAYLWGVATGYVVSATSNTVTLNDFVTLEEGKSYSFRLYTRDGLFQTKSITDSAGTYKVLNLLTSFSPIPSKYDVWTIGEGLNTVREVQISRMEWTSDREVKITAIEYNSVNYDASITDLEAFVPKPSLTSNQVPPDVTDVQAIESCTVLPDGTIATNIDVYWTKPVSAIYHHADVWLGFVEVASQELMWSDEPSVEGVKGNHAKFQILVSEVPKVFYIAVTSVSVFGSSKRPEDISNVSLTILGKCDAPSGIINFEVNRIENVLAFTWDPVSDKDISHYRIKQGSTWNSGVLVADIVFLNRFNFTLFYADWTKGSQGDISQTFMIKSVDTSGNENDTEASSTVTVQPHINSYAFVDRDDRGSTWPGTKTDMTVAGSGELEVDSGVSVGQYDTGNIELAIVAVRARATLLIETSQSDITSDWASSTFAWESDEADNRNWEGQVGVDALSVLVEVKYGDTLTEINNASFKKWAPTERTFRYIRFRVTLTLLDPSMTGALEEFKVMILAPYVVNSDTGVSTSSGSATTVTFDEPYGNENEVTVVPFIENAATGYYAVVSNITKTTFDIEVFDSSDKRVARTISYTATGF